MGWRWSDKMVMNDPSDIILYYIKSALSKPVYTFLAGLDKSFDQLLREIVRCEPLLSLEECYSLVQREAIRSTTMNEDIEKHEASAMVSCH